jgi:RimJ/RimL family protein N-acetyltransferase
MITDLQPTLEGERVLLRPLRPDDFDALYAVARDPLIWEQHPASDRWQEPVFRKFFADALASGGAFLVIDRRTGEVVGSSRYHGYDAQKREVEIGWTFLARSHWGGHFNHEMKRLMLEHAFGFVDTVLFFVGVNNVRSQRAVERIGAARRGVQQRASSENAVYALTAETCTLPLTRR